ncbi:hypothetical protein LCM10_05875 [Rossellomorea aquimaris]|uniref:hypothetical protein n=1 Tax=Rossellomorea aquimaris TaxID=189382 RepID=UPI001CD7A6AD|nr:hypothetical protein [Rossellomorea aquimaris]MCA1054508.1 hypothetical protein [Rossellomorea aquimaris]
MLMITLVTVSVLIYMVYYRYAPVRVKRLSEGKVGATHIVVDVRDYQDSYKSNCKQALAIPCGYLKRYAHEIPDEPLVVIGSSAVECNVGIRQLKRLGFNVAGYLIVLDNNPCDESFSMG